MEELDEVSRPDGPDEGDAFWREVGSESKRVGQGGQQVGCVRLSPAYGQERTSVRTWLRSTRGLAACS